MNKSWLLTNIFHTKAIVFIKIGDVVLGAKLHTVGGPNSCVVCVKVALPVWMLILRTFLPFTAGRTEELEEATKKKSYCEANFKVKLNICTHNAVRGLYSLFLQVKNSESSRSRQVLEDAWTPPATKRLLFS